MRQEIARVLELRAPLMSRESIYREELHLSVEQRPVEEKKLVKRLAALLVEYGTPAIVYVPKVKLAKYLKDELQK